MLRVLKQVLLSMWIPSNFKKRGEGEIVKKKRSPTAITFRVVFFFSKLVTSLPQQIKEAADIIQKLHLIAQELPFDR